MPDEPQTEITTPIHSNLTAAEAKTAQQISEWLAKSGTKAKRLRRLFWIAIAMIIFTSCLSFGLIPVIPVPIAKSAAVVLFYVILASLLGTLFLILSSLTEKQTWNAEELAQVGEVQAIGTIIDVLMSPGLEVPQPLLVEALTALLPQRRKGDGYALNSVQAAFLIRFLRIRFSGGVSSEQWNDYRVAVLQALEHIGTVHSIPHVERLAAMKIAFPDEQRVRHAAIECLATLKASSGNMEASKSLLRASQAGVSSPETLLRPASSGEETAQHQLLHAAHPDENTPPAE